MNEQELQVYWKDILNTMNEGLMLIGADGTILLANKALSDLSGYSEEELVGSNCSLFHSEICEHARTGRRRQVVHPVPGRNLQHETGPDP